MKTIKKFCAIILCLCVLVVCVAPKSFDECSAKSSNGIISAVDELNKLSQNFGGKTRIAGSDEEKIFAEYLKTQMLSISGLLPKGIDSSGFVSFSFEQKDGSIAKSQNVIFVKDNAETDKKIVLGAHYDSASLDEEKQTEGVNSNLAGIAVLLAVAKQVATLELPFDVEFVLFGAGECGNAGSYNYTLGLEQSDCEKIILMINLDKLAVGDRLCFYTDELDTKNVSFVKDCAKDVGVGIEEINKALTLAQDTNSELGLTYTHKGLQSDNVNFAKLGINTIYFFKDNNVLENVPTEDVTYTEKDSLKDLTDIYGDEIIRGVYNTQKVVCSILTNENCATFFAGHTAQSVDNFTDMKIVMFCMLASLTLFWCIYKLIQERMMKTAHEFAQNVQNEENMFTKFGKVVHKSEIDEVIKNEEKIQKFFKKSLEKETSAIEKKADVKEKKENGFNKDESVALKEGKNSKHKDQVKDDKKTEDLNEQDTKK